MGERKGTNKYYPPDFDPAKHGSLNRYHGSHPLRERARKLSQGILVIRFEMPFNIWCDGCKNHIGMGVRYNAEKRKVGNYYTTPIYRWVPPWVLPHTDPSSHSRLHTDAMFRLDHGLCDLQLLRRNVPTLTSLQEAQRAWKDDYGINCVLRARLRVGMDPEEEEEAALRMKLGLNVPLLPEDEDDRRLARCSISLPRMWVLGRCGEIWGWGV
ncbi:LOW QUALITY PROTEIN: coiled-coil domain-containing protein 130 [Coturnix japonica]|uniref:LOW QUALITY PROTEIN: coiled-coil domain-containing protein 130 n=1 Tax=Coturnix japonica TaxID=93934 RepID=UPI0007777005|nr:LOW QUALITY PROTEIN: coiled-coil domain-containing protein 130 [Coturnix japonica]